MIQRVQSIYSHGVQSDDSHLSDRHIYNALSTARLKVLSLDTHKRKTLNPLSYQILECVELEKAPTHECPCLPPIGCDILKTKHKVPRIISNRTVTSIDGSVVYMEVSWTEKIYKNANKYTAKKPDYYAKNEYLYITNQRGISAVNISGVFEDALSVEMFPSLCKDVGCFDPYQVEFPLSGEAIESVLEIAYRDLLLLFNQTTSDTANNGKEEREVQNKPSEL